MPSDGEFGPWPAIPSNAPIEPNVDLDMLMQLDLSGAAIVAPTAALLAADASLLHGAP